MVATVRSAAVMAMVAVFSLDAGAAAQQRAVRILVGAGGVIAATEGKEATLPAGTVLRVRLDTPLTVR